MQIPYTTENHPETGVFNAKLGVWLFLASEVMLFGALFSSYILLRTNATHWPHGVDEGLNIPLATLNTMVLIASSVTMVMSWAAARLHDLKKFRLWMGITFLCGLAFLGIKYIEYSDKFHHGHLPANSTFLAIYFTLTGLHGLHVIGGMIVNGYLWGPGVKLFHRDPARFANRIEVAGLYWHFVDLVWIFLFPVLYLL